MKVNVIASIIDFLQDHNTLGIPGLGSFEMQSVRRKFVLEDDKIKLPEKTLSFSEKRANEELFAEHLANSWKLGIDRARQILSSFGQRIVEELVAEGTADLPGIGKFSYSPDNQLQFLPEERNFHLQYFGLPEIELVPLSVPMGSGTGPAGNPPLVTSVPSAQAPATNESWLRAILSLALFLTILILSLKMCDNRTSSLELPWQTAEAGSGEEGGNEVSLAEAPGMSFFDSMAAENPQIEKYKDVLTDEVLKTGCIIIVGSFKNPRNAVRMKDRLIREGYQPYSELYGDFTRVGILFDCVDQDLIEYIQDTRKKYHAKSWYLTPDFEVPYQ